MLIGVSLTSRPAFAQDGGTTLPTPAPLPAPIPQAPDSGPVADTPQGPLANVPLPQLDPLPEQPAQSSEAAAKASEPAGNAAPAAPAQDSTPANSPAPAPQHPAVIATDPLPAPVTAAAPQQFNDELSLLEKADAAAFEKLRVDDFAGAIPFVQEALQLSEKIYGPDAAETGAASQNLGFLLTRTGRTAEAVPYLERAFSIYERTPDASYADTRKVVGALTSIYLKAGRRAEALRMNEVLLARAEQGQVPADLDLANLRATVAALISGTSRAEEAGRQWEQAIVIYREKASPEDEGYRSTIEGLVRRYVQLGKADQARTLIAESLRALETRGQQQGRTALRLLNRGARLEQDAGNYARAREQALAALAIVDRAGPSTSPDAVEPLNNLARAERALADDAGAEEHYKRAIAILDTQGDAANAGILNDNLAVLYGKTGRYDEAEPYHKRAIQLLEQALGRDHAEVGRAVANFGVLLNEAGRYTDAEPMLRRGLAIAETQGQDLVSIAIILDNLGGLLRQTERMSDAKIQIERALSLFKQALPASHPTLATSRNNLGRLLIDIGRYDEAVAQLGEALTASEAAFGADHANTAIPAANLGEAYAALGQNEKARGLLARALVILERQFGPSHAKLLETLVAIGKLELADHHPAEARAVLERAVDIELGSRSRFGVRARPSRDQQGTERQAFSGLLEALWQTREASQGGNVERALEIGQWNTMTPAALALNALGARAGAGDPGLAALTRQRQDLAGDWDATDTKLTQLLAQTGERDAAAEKVLREKLAATEAQLAEIDQVLAGKFPRFEDLAKPAPLSSRDVQALLRPNQAALQYVVTPQATYVWVISADGTKWLRLPVGERDLLSLVRVMRCGLDRAEWIDSGQARCLSALGLPKEAVLGETDPLPFQPERAYGLYQMLLGQLGEAIQGKDLMIVASGPLTSLPFHVLVSAQPEAGVGDDGNYSKVAFLGREHAISMLPSLSSLKSLRLYAQVSRATGPFLGIGNPLLTGEDGKDRSAFARQSCAPQSTSPAHIAQIAPVSLQRLVRGGLASVEDLRRQTPLPETADELCSVARFVGAPGDAVLLGSKATETNVKALSASGTLAGARILHLATHGLIAGETELFLASRSEPSLILTPPDKATDTDDGLLTASEVASLKLDADWVVLSACNTASGDQVGAESLSGLARAFFYAGARSLMVSHWAVDSEATVKIVTGAFSEMTQNPGTTQAGALQRAMVALIDSGGLQSHPAFWAPFVVVGSDGLASEIAAVDDMPAIIPPVPEMGPAAKEKVRSAALEQAGSAQEQATADDAPVIIPPVPKMGPAAKEQVKQAARQAALEQARAEEEAREAAREQARAEEAAKQAAREQARAAEEAAKQAALEQARTAKESARQAAQEPARIEEAAKQAAREQAKAAAEAARQAARDAAKVAEAAKQAALEQAKAAEDAAKQAVREQAKAEEVERQAALDASKAEDGARQAAREQASITAEAVKQAAVDAAGTMEIPPPPSRLVNVEETVIIPPLPVRASVLNKAPEPAPQQRRRRASSSAQNANASSASGSASQSSQIAPSQTVPQGQSLSPAGRRSPPASSNTAPPPPAGGAFWNELFGQ